MQLAGDTVRYISKTLEKTRALYLKWLGRSTPAKWNGTDFEM